jgi:hypothetical protein
MEREDAETWTAFERAVDVVVKSGPQHRVRPHEGRPYAGLFSAIGRFRRVTPLDFVTPSPQGVQSTF